MDDRIRRAKGLIERENFAEAFTVAAEAMTDDYSDPRACYLAGVALRQLGHIGPAAVLFSRALSKSSEINIWLHYGACLHDMHRYDEAREVFKRVAKAAPTDPMPLANIASGYVQQGKAREAIEWGEKALALDPESYIAHIAMGFGCLSLGRWRDGWKHAEWLYGHHLRVRVYNPPEREEPVWDGSKGKTVVVQCDQGLGDELMFASILPDMVQDCTRVIIECDPRLESLFKRSFPQCDVFGTRKQTEIAWPLDYEIDAHVHISWLGRYYRNEASDFPRVPYLFVSDEGKAAWREWLAQFPRPWVGITWRGGITASNSKARSFALEEYAPIITQGGTFFDMSYQDTGAEVAAWNIAHPQQIVKPPLPGDKYESTMALLSQLDHVISVQTALVHAAGSMGCKAWVLVPNVPAWRYGLGRADMIWYPENSIHLYRQAPGEPDFGACINRVSSDYGAFILPRFA